MSVDFTVYIFFFLLRMFIENFSFLSFLVSGLWVALKLPENIYHFSLCKIFRLKQRKIYHHKIVISYHFKTQTCNIRPRLNPDQNISFNLAFKFNKNSNKIYFKDCFCCIWYSCSKQDICKASVKYIISIGDDDVWWRLQQHRSVSNEWMSKPGSWISKEYL